MNLILVAGLSTTPASKEGTEQMNRQGSRTEAMRPRRRSTSGRRLKAIATRRSAASTNDRGHGVEAALLWASAAMTTPGITQAGTTTTIGTTRGDWSPPAKEGTRRPTSAISRGDGGRTASPRTGMMARGGESMMNGEAELAIEAREKEAQVGIVIRIDARMTTRRRGGEVEAAARNEEGSRSCENGSVRPLSGPGDPKNPWSASFLIPTRTCPPSFEEEMAIATPGKRETTECTSTQPTPGGDATSTTRSPPSTRRAGALYTIIHGEISATKSK